MAKEMQIFNKTDYLSRLDASTVDSAVDINFFKHSLPLHDHNAYLLKIRECWIYRLIFFGFSLFFIFLAIMIYFKTANFMCTLYFSNSFFVKNFVNCSCLLLASCSFAIGYIIRPEQEALHYLFGRVEQRFSSAAKHWEKEINSIFQSFAEEWKSHHKWNHSIDYLRLN